MYIIVHFFASKNFGPKINVFFRRFCKLKESWIGDSRILHGNENSYRALSYCFLFFALKKFRSQNLFFSKDFSNFTSEKSVVSGYFNGMKIYTFITLCLKNCGPEIYVTFGDFANFKREQRVTPAYFREINIQLGLYLII